MDTGNNQQTAKHQKRKIVFLVPGYLDLYKRKGVSELITDRDEFGYFDMVYTVHFPAPRDTVIRLNKRHTVVEFCRPFHDVLGKFPGARYVSNLLMLFTIVIHMRRLIMREHVTLIRSVEPNLHGFCAYLLSRLTGVPFCISIHTDFDLRYRLGGSKSVPVYFGSRWLTEKLMLFNLRKAKLVIIPLRGYLVPSLVDKGISVSKIRVTKLALDFDKLDRIFEQHKKDIRKTYHIGNKKLVLFTGRLHPENYIEDIIELSAMLRKNQDILICLLGMDEDGYYGKLINEKNAENVRYFGSLPRWEALLFKKTAEVNLCVMGGLSLLESAYLAKPIVCYDVEWHSDLIKNYESGVLVKEHDIKGLKDSITYLLDHPAVARRMGKSAREVILREYSRRQISKQLVGYYGEIVQNKAHDKAV